MKKSFQRNVLLPKLSLWSIKIIDGFLANHEEELRYQFALRWFENNEDKLKDDGFIIPENVSNDWKVSMVLSSRLFGGFDAQKHIKKIEYKDIKNKLNKVQALRYEIKKESISPEASFLLINYLKGKPNTGLVINELINKVTKKNLFLRAQKIVEADNARAKWIVKNMKVLSKEELVHAWADEHEKRINDKINEFVGQLAGSFGVSAENIKNLYSQAKQDSVLEFNKNLVKFASFDEKQTQKLLKGKEFKKIALLNKEEKTALDNLKDHWQVLLG